MTERPSQAMAARRRMAWTLAALAATVATQATVRGSAWLVGLVLVSVIAMCVATLGRQVGNPSARGLLAQLDVAIAASLVFLLLPAQTSLVLAGAATILSVPLTRSLFGGLGQNLFNPAMLALAIIFLSTSTAPASVAWSAWAAATCWLGGGLLVVRRVLPWRAPIAFLIAALAVAVVFGGQETPVERIVGMLLDPTLVLCAFFVAGDSTSGCVHDRARWAFGLGSGALVMALDTGTSGVALPFAMLAMNFLAPWLDQALANNRPRAVAK